MTPEVAGAWSKLLPTLLSLFTLQNGHHNEPVVSMLNSPYPTYATRDEMQTN